MSRTYDDVDGMNEDIRDMYYNMSTSDLVEIAMERHDFDSDEDIRDYYVNNIGEIEDYEDYEGRFQIGDIVRIAKDSRVPDRIYNPRGLNGKIESLRCDEIEVQWNNGSCGDYYADSDLRLVERSA